MPKAQNGQLLARVLIQVRRNANGEVFATFQNRSNIGGREKRVSYKVPAADHAEILKEAAEVVAAACKGAPETSQPRLKK